MDLASRIRARLAEGHAVDEIVAQLIAGGMSESNARRIVERVQTAPSPDVSLDDAADETPEDAKRAEDPSGRREMVLGAFFLSLGVGFLFVSTLAGDPDPKYRVTWGAILAGIAGIAAGLRRWDPQRTPFPAWPLLAALVLPAASAYGFYEYLRVPSAAERTATAEREEQRRVAEVQERERAAFERKGAALLEARANIKSAEPRLRCSAADFFSAHKIRGATGELKQVLRDDPNLQVKRCTMEALLAMGQKRDALEVLAQLTDARYAPITMHGLGRLLQDPDPDIRARAAEVYKRVR